LVKASRESNALPNSGKLNGRNAFHEGALLKYVIVFEEYVDFRSRCATPRGGLTPSTSINAAEELKYLFEKRYGN
jgi:hypothetical protein